MLFVNRLYKGFILREVDTSCIKASPYIHIIGYTITIV
jgi:hypothetical protein